ncbi:MAG: hypothetical protein QOF60_279 [Actinomycetota bacterium]|jgi:hypothetical protein|nr:hypothetical protein [Actinomycetota bacterium]
MSRRTVFVAAFAALAPLALAACGGNDSPAVSPTETTTTTKTATVKAGGTGTGQVAVGDKTFAFEVKPCTIDGDSVRASGAGTMDGKPFTVVVERAIDTSLIETVQVAITAQQAVVATNFSSAKTGGKLTVAGGRVKGTLAFTGTGGLPSGEGTLDLLCKGA